MLISNTHRISKIVAAILLAVIISVFSYSELGQYGFDNTTNDYCEIVKSAQASKDLTNNLFKLQVDKTISLHWIVEEINIIVAFKFNKLVSEQFHTPQKTTKVYLFNRTFLI